MDDYTKYMLKFTIVSVLLVTVAAKISGHDYVPPPFNPDGPRVLYPFDVGACVFYSGMRCVRYGSYHKDIDPDGINGIPQYGLSGFDEFLEMWDIDYVCCDGNKWHAFSMYDKALCNHFMDETVFIDYGGDYTVGVEDSYSWKKCWQTKHTIKQSEGVM